MTKEVEKLMQKLDISEDEALQLMADDKAIDKGEKLFELSKEQKQFAKKYTTTGQRAKSTEKVVRTHKDNPVKADIIQYLFTKMNDYSAENVQILNKERQISFVLGEESYELTLVQKRKPKK